MKNAFKKFRTWSANNHWVYSCISIVPWAYQVIFRKTFVLGIATGLIVLQLTGLVLLLVSRYVWKKYRE